MQEGQRTHDNIAALDGIRGIAILLVMGLHYTIRYGDIHTTAGKLVRLPLQIGWCGVDIFFVLSGFLITGILLKQRGRERYYRNFYMRRVLRIFPLYYFVLAISFFVLPWVPAVAADVEYPRLQQLQGWLWTYLANIVMARNGHWEFNCETVRLGHLWSLAIEEHFYFVWPWLVSIVEPKRLLRVGAAIILGTTALRLLMSVSGIDPFVGYVLTFTRADSLVLGGCLAVLVRDPAILAQLGRFTLPAIAAGPLAVAFVVLKAHSVRTENWTTQIIAFPALAVMAAGLIVAGIRAKPGELAHRVFASRFLTTIGKYSYGLYVYHQLVQPIAERWLAPSRFHFGEAGGLVAHVIASMILAQCVAFTSWHVFEKRFLSLKRFFEYDPRRDASVSARAAESTRT